MVRYFIIPARWVLFMLSLVIPVLNEAENIDPLLAEIAAVMTQLPELTEAVFINDGSTDDTLKILQNAKKQYPWVSIVSLEKSTGKSSAQWYGIRAAKGELILTMDGDLQNNPADIPNLLNAYKTASAQSQKGVFVVGQRERRHDDWLRRVSSKTANRIRKALLKDDTRDSGCAVRLARRDDYLSLPFFGNMHRFISALAIQNGFELVLVDIGHRPRVAGVAKYGLWNRLIPGIVDLFGMLWLGHRRRRTARVSYH